MARSKKKALSQRVVGVATTGMPSPVRKFLGGRLIALLIVIVTPILFATGVVSFEWRDGRPKLSFNRQRAGEVRKKTANTIQDLRDQNGQDQDGLRGVFSKNGGAKESKFMAELRPKEDFSEHVRETIDGNREQGLGFTPRAGEDETRDGQVTRRKRLFDKLR